MTITQESHAGYISAEYHGKITEAEMVEKAKEAIAILNSSEVGMDVFVLIDAGTNMVGLANMYLNSTARQFMEHKSVKDIYIGIDGYNMLLNVLVRMGDIAKRDIHKVPVKELQKMKAERDAALGKRETTTHAAVVPVDPDSSVSSQQK